MLTQLEGMTLNECISSVALFQETFGLPMEQAPKASLSPDIIALRHRLMAEENDEYLEAAKDGDMVEIADALGDMLYILCGTIISHGMQDVIADQFASRTILTIAHRINTIIENDKVVCLEQGRLQRMDSPAAMLRDPESMFAKLVAETGEQSARNLRARAEECDAARVAGLPIRRVGSKDRIKTAGSKENLASPLGK